MSICFYQTPDGIVRIGTEDGGAYKIDPNRKLITKILEIGSQILDFYLDSSGLLWIGSIASGLICYDPAKNIVIDRFIPYPDNPEGIKTNLVFKIVEDKTGFLYLTQTKVLVYIIVRQKNLIFLMKKTVCLIILYSPFLSDDHNNYWLCTRKGISKFNTYTKQFQNYDVSYGLPENGFYFEWCLENPKW